MKKILDSELKKEVVGDCLLTGSSLCFLSLILFVLWELSSYLYHLTTASSFVAILVMGCLSACGFVLSMLFLFGSFLFVVYFCKMLYLFFKNIIDAIFGILALFIFLKYLRKYDIEDIMKVEIYD